ncbi:MAG: hypothetical protein MUF15_15100, partial [Acidobacteria bacterium]|nr:hypothetical protein [Acidobacteriota bacterium]
AAGVQEVCCTCKSCSSCSAVKPGSCSRRMAVSSAGFKNRPKDSRIKALISLCTILSSGSAAPAAVLTAGLTTAGAGAGRVPGRVMNLGGLGILT